MSSSHSETLLLTILWVSAMLNGHVYRYQPARATPKSAADRVHLESKSATTIVAQAAHPNGPKADAKNKPKEVLIDSKFVRQ